VSRGFVCVDKSDGGFFESIAAAAELDGDTSVQEAIEDRGAERGVAEAFAPVVDDAIGGYNAAASQRVSGSWDLVGYGELLNSFHMSAKTSIVSIVSPQYGGYTTGSAFMQTNPEVFITCAVTGSGDTVKRNPHVPVTPAEIADAALAAAAAGASIVHLHARDPETGKNSRNTALFREAVERIRERNMDVIVNLTGGNGGDLIFGADEPLKLDPNTDVVGPDERIAHIVELRPEIASLDCGSLNFDDVIYATTPSYLRRMASTMQRLGIKPEIEVFDLGHVELAKQLMSEGLIDANPHFQLCLGIKYGAPATPDAMKALRDALPRNATWSAFGIGRLQMPMVAQSILMGGNVRVGLEDNLYLDRGTVATNEQLVRRAVSVIELMGSRVLGPAETRTKLGLRTVERVMQPA
jgi:uncharacterized protein (DUF849 family)